MAHTVLHGTSDWRFVLNTSVLCSEMYKRAKAYQELTDHAKRHLQTKQKEYLAWYNLKQERGRIGRSEEFILRDLERDYMIPVVEGYFDVAVRQGNNVKHATQVVLEFVANDALLMKPSSEIGFAHNPIYNIWGQLSLRGLLSRVYYGEKHVREELEHRLQNGWAGVKLEHKDFK